MNNINKQKLKLLQLGGIWLVMKKFNNKFSKRKHTKRKHKKRKHSRRSRYSRKLKRY